MKVSRRNGRGICAFTNLNHIFGCCMYRLLYMYIHVRQLRCSNNTSTSGWKTINLMNDYGILRIVYMFASYNYVSSL
jgi:hypothetical protein